MVASEVRIDGHGHSPELYPVSGQSLPHRLGCLAHVLLFAASAGDQVDDAGCHATQGRVDGVGPRICG